MELKEQRIGERLLLRATGRLDATWADFFKESLLQHIRDGEHQIVLDASELVFLSSLGIRSLMVIYKKLTEIEGTFQIIHAQGMVKETLKASGLEMWLSDEEIAADAGAQETADDAPFHFFPLTENATLIAQKTDAWSAWDPVRLDQCKRVPFTPANFGFGIGAAGDSPETALKFAGEFLAVGGQVAIQPPDERGRPDCLLSAQQFIPELYTLQSWTAHGEMARLMRFRSDEAHPFFPLSTLIQTLADQTDATALGFILIGEVEGLAGAQLIQSPANLTAGNAPAYPEIKEWLSYCGERVFNRELVIITGMISRDNTGPWTDLRRLSQQSQLFGHMHAAVFPYQFLPNGPLHLTETVQRIFNGPPPKAVMHLVADERPGIGIGETALYNGACWFAPVTTDEVHS